LEFCGGDREIIVARELTKKFEEHLGNNINDVLMHFKDKEVIGEITLIIKGIKKENYQGINKADLKKDLHELIKAGLTLSAASKYLAKKNGIKKSIIYNLN
jgi:16S rRNA (cytidine1402-2'-O)-methyltransferase